VEEPPSSRKANGCLGAGQAENVEKLVENENQLRGHFAFLENAQNMREQLQPIKLSLFI
jgi:hypothetical protein